MGLLHGLECSILTHSSRVEYIPNRPCEILLLRLQILLEIALVIFSDQVLRDWYNLPIFFVLPLPLLLTLKKSPR